jgi:2-polyprenyl-6-methoxyphenol hydroxylase-like FAD-dependent oxidoreductase
MTSAAKILVVGAGPTGLALALQAHTHGARVRIIERRRAAFRPSRALIMHPRTLEALCPLGVTEPLLAQADCALEARLHLGSRVIPVHLAHVTLADTTFPPLSLVRQADVEAILTEALADRGVMVERGVELIDFVEARRAGDRVLASLKTSAGHERVECDFLVGCDGPESVVRRLAGIGWRGAPYRQEVILADLEVEGDLALGMAHVVVGKRGLLFLFALGERATWRLLATVPSSSERLAYGQPGPPISLDRLQGLIDETRLGARATEVAWSARYPLQHRMATHLRRGAIFLAGDAAHAYSPATGQGMNTGIQDAINLGWKLAFAPAACNPGALLDSYERERRPAACHTLAITHAAFWVEASTSRLPSLLRCTVAPLSAPVAPALLKRPRIMGALIRSISRLQAAYRHSPVSMDGSPRLRAGPRVGQRLRDASVTCEGRPVRLHALLAQQAGVHVFLFRDANHLDHLERPALGAQVAVHRLTSVPGAGLVAVRPDGYVGFRCGVADASQLEAWLTSIGAR